MKGFTLMALLVITGWHQAHAQTVAQVSGALSSVRLEDKLLQDTYDNLNAMAIGEEKPVVDSILDELNMFRTSVGIVIAVGNVLVKMRDPEDAKAARVQFQYSLGNVLKQLDVAVKYTNSYMALMKGQAALAEATKARDAMIASREQLRSLAN
jgi:hypothetical protein